MAFNSKPKQATERTPRRKPLPSHILTAVQSLIASEGPRRAAEKLGTSRNAVIQAAAGLPVNAGTELMIVMGLRALQADGSAEVLAVSDAPRVRA